MSYDPVCERCGVDHHHLGECPDVTTLKIVNNKLQELVNVLAKRIEGDELAYPLKRGSTLGQRILELRKI